MSELENGIEDPKKRSIELDVAESESEVKKLKTETVNPEKIIQEQDQDTEKSDKEQSSKELTKEDSKNDKPKHVFGSTTGFGQMDGFKMFGSTGAFSWSEKKDDNITTKEEPKEVKSDKDESEKTKTTSTFGSSSVFGSGSTFKNAFQDAVKTKSIFDEPEKKEKDNKNKDQDQEEEGEKEEGGEEDKEEKVELDVYKKVHLEKQDVKSGEENETTLFQAKAKLYYMELANVSDGWKEKGLGIIKVNKYNESPSKLYTSRLIMRQDGNFKLILNLPLIEGFNIVKGMPSSLHANKFLRIQAVNGEKPIQYALKLQVDNVTGLYDSIQKQIPTKSTGNDVDDTTV